MSATDSKENVKLIYHLSDSTGDFDFCKSLQLFSRRWTQIKIPVVSRGQNVNKKKKENKERAQDSRLTATPRYVNIQKLPDRQRKINRIFVRTV